ncbi:MAG: bifunctional nicotinamidase/pyrazinamidase [Bacteroidales bacterium]
MNALLIADIQYDFLPGGALGVPEGNDIIPLINKLQLDFPLVVATQDWHPAGHGSFASAHPGKKPFETIQLDGLDQILWPDHCVQGSKGAELAVDLNQNQIEAIFRKGMDQGIDSYSGFFDNGRKKSTGLSDYLKGRGVDQVYVVGLAGDFCVAFTALDAIGEGFRTFLIEDATRPIDAEGFKLMKEKILSRGGKIISSGQIL